MRLFMMPLSIFVRCLDITYLTNKTEIYTNLKKILFVSLQKLYLNMH